MTTTARTVGRVKGKRTRLKRRDIDAAVHTCHAFRVELFFAVNDGDKHRTIRQLQSRADGFGETFIDARFDKQTINDGLDSVIAPLVEFDVFIEREQLSVNSRSQETIFSELFKLLFEL